MKHFYNHGIGKNFYVAIGYKGIVLKDYFRKNKFPWNVKLIETGQKTMTGGRIKRLKNILEMKDFL